jgi:sugar fermentation stimulation protein A
MYTYPPLHEGAFLRRYKRFFVDIETEQGMITAHNPNTGSMRSLLAHGNPVLYSVSDNAKRSLPYTLELINVDGEWIVSNTIRVNQLVESAFYANVFPSLYSGKELRREFTFKDSKIDFLLNADSNPTLVEVKSVTYFDDKVCYFPDAVTTRGRKHLHTLMEAVREGYRAVMLYVCMADRPSFACATHIDPDYCKALNEAERAGVEVVTAKCRYDRKSNSCTLKI